jgi:hypothetical protein
MRYSFQAFSLCSPIESHQIILMKTALLFLAIVLTCLSFKMRAQTFTYNFASGPEGWSGED